MRLTGKKHLSFTFILGFSLMLFSTSLSAEHLPSFPQIELSLRIDSLNPSLLAQYGLLLLTQGDSRAEHIIDASYSLESSPETRRGLASLAVRRGDLDEAISVLDSLSKDPFENILLCALLQEKSNLHKSDSILQTLLLRPDFKDAVDLLLTRQIRLQNLLYNTEVSFIGTSDSTCKSDFLDILYLENLLHNPLLIPLNREKILRGLRADLYLTGGLYTDDLLKFLSINSYLSNDTLFLSHANAISGRWEEAERILAHQPIINMSFEELVFFSDILLETNNLNDLEVVLNFALNSFPLSSRLLANYGELLVKSGRHKDAFETMRTAVEQTQSPACMAIQGLSAELVGEYQLATAAYATLFEISADSIILVNRYRNIFTSTYPFLTSTTSVYDGQRWENSSSGIKGSTSITLFNSSGEYEQRHLSLSGSVVYGYGYYGNRIRASANYSHNTWPGSQSSYTSIRTSLLSKICFNSSFYQTTEIVWESKKGSENRWQFDAITGAGYTFDFGRLFEIDPSLSIGRRAAFWKENEEITDSYIVIPKLDFSVRNFLSSSFNPRLDFFGELTQDIFDREMYVVDIYASISGSISDNVSISYSNSLEFFSKVPPDNGTLRNSSTHISLRFSF